MGLWNGIGGKPKNDESLVQSVKREVNEEICVRVKNADKVADLFYYYINCKNKMDWHIHAYLVKAWEGEPKESEEMKPKWFRFFEVPYDQMWNADHLWTPRILKGEKVKARIGFDKNDKLVEHTIEAVKEF